MLRHTLHHTSGKAATMAAAPVHDWAYYVFAVYEGLLVCLIGGMFCVLLPHQCAQLRNSPNKQN